MSSSLRPCIGEIKDPFTLYSQHNGFWWLAVTLHGPKPVISNDQIAVIPNPVALWLVTIMKFSWWRHQMEASSRFWSIVRGIHFVTCGLPVWLLYDSRLHADFRSLVKAKVKSCSEAIFNLDLLQKLVLCTNPSVTGKRFILSNNLSKYIIKHSINPNQLHRIYWFRNEHCWRCCLLSVLFGMTFQQTRWGLQYQSIYEWDWNGLWQGTICHFNYHAFAIRGSNSTSYWTTLPWNVSGRVERAC